jgi:hypothetical protein
LASLPEFAAEPYQITVREIIDKDLNDLEGTALTVHLPIPEQFGTETKVSAPDIIAGLPGDAEKGKIAAVKKHGARVEITLEVSSPGDVVEARFP